MDGLLFLIPVAGILAGVAIVLMAMWVHVRQREAATRERLALIERGITPPVTMPGSPLARTTLRRAERYRSGGVIFMGTGIGLGLLIGVAAQENDVGLGVGGAIFILGLALFLNAVLLARDAGRMPPEPPADEVRPGGPAQPAAASPTFFEGAGGPRRSDGE